MDEGPGDKLTASELTRELNTKTVGKKIISYNIVDSTNSVAFSLAEQGLPEGTSVFAEGQAKGRGRLGRKWISPQSKGIYVSLILRPKISPQKAPLITILAAVACAKAIRKACGLAVLIRWPNDILLNQKKVSGILTEMQAAGDKIKFIILGIGINVSTPKSLLPKEAGSLDGEAGGLKCSRLELARELLRKLDKEYLDFKHKGSEEIVARWRNLSFLSGRRVKVFFQYGSIEGQAQDIDEQGALIIRLDNGFKQHITAGDIVKIR